MMAFPIRPWGPAHRRSLGFVGSQAPRRYGLGRGPLLGQTFDQILGVPPYVGNLLRLGAHGITSYLGFHVALESSGWLSAAGWAVGILQGMGVLVDIFALISDLQEALKKRQAFEAFEEPL